MVRKIDRQLPQPQHKHDMDAEHPEQTAASSQPARGQAPLSVRRLAPQNYSSQDPTRGGVHIALEHSVYSGGAVWLAENELRLMSTELTQTHTSKPPGADANDNNDNDTSDMLPHSESDCIKDESHDAHDGVTPHPPHQALLTSVPVRTHSQPATNLSSPAMSDLEFKDISKDELFKQLDDEVMQLLVTCFNSSNHVAGAWVMRAAQALAREDEFMYYANRDQALELIERSKGNGEEKLG